MKNAFNLGIANALYRRALRDMGRSAGDIFELEPDAGLGQRRPRPSRRLLYGQAWPPRA